MGQFQGAAARGTARPLFMPAFWRSGNTKMHPVTLRPKIVIFCSRDKKNHHGTSELLDSITRQIHAYMLVVLLSLRSLLGRLDLGSAQIVPFASGTLREALPHSPGYLYIQRCIMGLLDSPTKRKYAYRLVLGLIWRNMLVRPDQVAAQSVPFASGACFDIPQSSTVEAAIDTLSRWGECRSTILKAQLALRPLAMWPQNACLRKMWSFDDCGLAIFGPVQEKAMILHCTSLCISVSLYVCLSVLFVCMSVCVCMSACLSVCLPVCSVCMYVCVSFCIVCLSVCMYVWQTAQQKAALGQQPMLVTMGCQHNDVNKGRQTRDEKGEDT